MTTDSTISGSISPKTEPRTHAERLRWLAELDSERAGYAFHPDEPRVPRFPTLRQVCAARSHTLENELRVGCYGRGWKLVDSLEATLSCASEWRFETKAEDIVAMCRLHPISLAVLEHGLTHNEAAISALYKCVIVETKP